MLLQVDGVVKRFGGMVAVNGVTMAVNQGEIFGLIGPNGAGKTTLLNVIAGVEKPNSGKIHFNGKDVTGWNPEDLCVAGISRTFQVPRKFKRMSVYENVLVATTFGLAKPTKPLSEHTREALEFVNFPLPIDTIANKLNAAQLKRLDLARAIASQPKLLLLDEPASGLTPTEVDGLMQLIRVIRDTGVTIIVVEHLMKVIMNVCDRMVVLDHGEFIAEGAPDEIAKNPKVIEAYLGEEYLRETAAKAAA
ncbi:MAG: ABC transporter ATP-binding protein [Anaerolineales bacterium]|nr:ABC transporter ATP-binding protein [Anaerolineales bacterium]